MKFRITKYNSSAECALVGVIYNFAKLSREHKAIENPTCPVIKICFSLSCKQPYENYQMLKRFVYFTLH